MPLSKLIPNSKGLAMVGMMQAVAMKRDAAPPGPKIGPAFQGMRALKLLGPEQTGMLEYGLKDAAKKYKVRASELEWYFDSTGALHIKPRPRIEVPACQNS